MKRLFTLKMPTQKLLRLLLLLTDTSDEDRVYISLLQIWKLSLVIKLNFVQTLSTRFGQNFEVEVQTRFSAGVWPPFFADIL